MYNTNDKKSTQTTKKVHKRQKKYTNNKKSTQTTKTNTQTTTASTQKTEAPYRIEQLKNSIFFLVFVAKKLWEMMALLCHVTEKSLPD